MSDASNLYVPALYDSYSLPTGATASLCFDVLRIAGLDPAAVGSPLDPIDRYEPFIGRAFTVAGKADPNIDADESLKEWTRMLSITPPNAVLVIEPGDLDRAYMGELSANALRIRQAVAAIVDGPCRDTNQIRALRFPVFCRGVTPRDVVASWRPLQYGRPAKINGITVTSDDLVIGDSDGLCITHRSNYLTMITGLERELNSENLVREAILKGHDPYDAYVRYRKF